MKLLNIYCIEDHNTHEVVTFMTGNDDKNVVDELVHQNERIVKQNLDFFVLDSNLMKIANTTIVKIGTIDLADKTHTIVPVHNVISVPNPNRWFEYRDSLLGPDAQKKVADAKESAEKLQAQLEKEKMATAPCSDDELREEA